MYVFRETLNWILAHWVAVAGGGFVLSAPLWMARVSSAIEGYYKLKEARARAKKAERDLRDAVRKVGGTHEPRVILDYEYDGRSPNRLDNPFTVRNVGPVTAFEIQVHEVQTFTGYRATFPSVPKLLSGESPQRIYANVDCPGGLSPLFCGDFSLLLENFDWPNLPSKNEDFIPVFVSYKDFEGTVYTDEWSIEHQFDKRHAIIRLKRARVGKANRN